MALSVRLDGTLVAAPPARPYDFNDESDGRQIKGTTRKLYVVQDFAAEPVVVKFGDEVEKEFEHARGLGFGTPVALMVEAGRSNKFKAFAEAPKAAAR
jgi:hypothetical protein